MTKILLERLKETGNEYQPIVWVLESVDVNDEQDFQIDDNAIEKDICRLGHLLTFYGDLQAESKAQLARKESELKFTYATKAQEIRINARTTGDKVTEGTVNELVTISAAYQKVMSELNQTIAVSTRCDNWWRSMQKKADLIQSLAYRQGAELKRL